MSSFQKKLFTALFIVFLALLGLLLPHKSVNPAPQNITAVLGEVASNTGLSDLNIQPEAGTGFLVKKLQSAQKSIYLSIYLLSEPDIVDGLITAHTRGLDVKIIMEKAPFGGGNVNKLSKAKLTEAGIEVRDPPALIALLHEKALIIDHEELLILTENLTKAAFTNNREYSLSDFNQIDVSDGEKIFLADWNKLPYTSTSPNLVVSPENSREKLESLIVSATKELLVEDEVIQDPHIIKLLGEEAKNEPVEVLLSNPKSVAQNLTTAGDLRKAGVQVKFLLNPYLHAKLIIADQKFAYLGSINLTSQSLDQNRELGIIFTNPELITPLHMQFGVDWNLGED